MKGARFSIQIPFLDADGDPTDPVTPDTEISKDAGTFADCAEEITIIAGTNGVGYITLTGAETDASMLALAAKVASGPKATLATLYPRVLPVIFSGTMTAALTLATDIPAIDGLLKGCILKTTGGTGGGGTGGANNQARVITAFTTGRVVTLTPALEVATDSTTTYEILMTEAALLRWSDLQLLRGTQPNVLVSGRVDASVGAMAAGTVTAAAIATAAIDADALAADTITAAKIADGAIDAATFAAGAINAAAIGADAITAAKVAADVSVEIAGAVWNEDATGHQTQGSFGQVVGDSVADADSIWSLANTNLNATVGSRATQASVDTIDDFVDTEVAAILAAVDTEVAAIKAKTDQLVFTTANRVDSQVFGMEANTLTAAAIASTALTAAKFAADAITASIVAADVSTEIRDAIFARVIDTLTLRQLMGVLEADLIGKISGAATTTPTVRDPGDTLNRIAWTGVDADGNRPNNPTLNLTGL